MTVARFAFLAVLASLCSRTNAVDLVISVSFKGHLLCIACSIVLQKLAEGSACSYTLGNPRNDFIHGIYGQTLVKEGCMWQQRLAVHVKATDCEQTGLGKPGAMDC